MWVASQKNVLMKARVGRAWQGPETTEGDQASKQAGGREGRWASWQQQQQEEEEDGKLVNKGWRS